MSAPAVATRSKLFVHRSKESIRTLCRALDPSVSVGFVPTMGALHEGHLSLVRTAREENDIVVASIYVNPTQFGPKEDLDAYPRQFEKDSQLLDELGVDHVFAPATMYGPNHATYVDLPCWDDLAEGVSRPGHFRGVATIVTKLLNVVQPTNAYFGQKDAAQCVLVQRIVEDLDLVTKIHVCATVRATDGLALSSRNAYLTADERRAAPIVYRSLCAAKQLLLDAQVSNNQSVTAVQLQTAVRQILETEPLVSEIQYISVDSKLTMRPLETVTKEDGAIISLACKVGSVRLIDNVIL